MLTRLGRFAAPEDAAGLLLECHGRIREFLALAGRIAEASRVEEEALREAAVCVRRYFTEALPLHARDEEESVHPRLRGREVGLDRELHAMVREHRDHIRPLATLVAACEEIELQLTRRDAGSPLGGGRAPERLARLAPIVRRATEQLERHFAEHLRREETVIIPAMRRLLGPGDDAAIVREIRARRGGAGTDLTAGSPVGAR